MDAVEQVVRVMAQHNFAVVISDDSICAEVVANVAADWVSRLLGVAKPIHLALCCNTAAAFAGDLMLTDTVLFHVYLQRLFEVVHVGSTLFIIYDVPVILCRCEWLRHLRPASMRLSGGSVAVVVTTSKSHWVILWDTTLACSQISGRGL